MMIESQGPSRARPLWPALAAAAMLVGFWPVSTVQAQERPRTSPDTALGQIYGTVTDARTGKPVPGAGVLVVGTRIGSPTDQEGRFMILAAPTTAREIEIQGTCFRTVRVDVSSSLSPARPLRVDIGLPFQRPKSRPGVIVPQWACQEFGGT